MSTPFLVKDIWPGFYSSPGGLTALYSFTNKC